MSIFDKSIPIYCRRYNPKRDAIVDDVMQLRVGGDRVELVEGSALSRKVFRTIDPVYVRAFRDRGAIVRRNGKTEDEWYMNVRGSDGVTTGVRLRSKWDGVSMEKRIGEIIGSRSDAVA